MHRLTGRVVDATDRLADAREGLAAIGGPEHSVTKNVEFVFVGGRHADVGKFPPEDPEHRVDVVRIHLPPCLAAVVRAVDLAARDRSVSLPDDRHPIVDKGIHHARLARCDVQSRAPHGAGGQSGRDLLPSRTRVRRLVQPAFEPAFSVHCQLPGPGQEGVRVGWIHDDVDGSGLAADKERPRPRATTIRSLEHAALVVG